MFVSMGCQGNMKSETKPVFNLTPCSCHGADVYMVLEFECTDFPGCTTSKTVMSAFHIKSRGETKVSSSF